MSMPARPQISVRVAAGRTALCRLPGATMHRLLGIAIDGGIRTRRPDRAGTSQYGTQTAPDTETVIRAPNLDIRSTGRSVYAAEA